MLKALSTFKSRKRRDPGLSAYGSDRSRLFNTWSSRIERQAQEIIGASDELRSFSDRKLLEWSTKLQTEAGNSGRLRDFLPLAFALVRETSRRVHGQAHYDVQIIAGIGLVDGGIAEMQTGEGKTLAALLPAFLYALVGKGCHVVTSNDYLAKRDAAFAKLVFEKLGVSVGCLYDGLPRSERSVEYEKPVTYGTAREFGFDFLKDRVACRNESSSICRTNKHDRSNVQREHFFALVDEADSVMIDDARMPLIIASPAEDSLVRTRLIHSCNQIALKLTKQSEFELNRDRRSVTLTRQGCLAALQMCDRDLIQALGPQEIYRQAENSLSANYLFQANCHYIVEDGKVAIVDESTGRVADGRKWQSGLHQAIEAKEQLETTAGTKTLAKITVQSYFRRYRHLAGLTGTAQQVAREFKQVYSLGVTTIPTRRPSKRNGLNHRIFRRFEEKSEAIAVETIRRLVTGQAVLIGTPSVQASRRISQVLTRFEIKHEVLNCLEHEQESRIVEQAGSAGRVTVATNMAGRGTDIHVDDSVLQTGGLHIIATARHSSSRIDRQLIGRTARQGQPGTYQFILSLEDELFTIAGEQHNRDSQPSSDDQHSADGELNPKLIRLFDRAQARIERLHEKQRLNLRDAEKNRNKLCIQIGLDPCLELLEDE